MTEKTAAAPMTFAQMFWRKLREHSATYRAQSIDCRSTCANSKPEEGPHHHDSTPLRRRRR